MQSHGIATPEVGLVKSLTSASAASAATVAPMIRPDSPSQSVVLIPIVGGWVAVGADEAGDLLCWHSVRYRGRAVPEQATDAELRAELGALLFEHGMTGMGEAARECSWELRHGEPDDVADVRRWRELARRLVTSAFTLTGRGSLAVAR